MKKAYNYLNLHNHDNCSCCLFQQWSVIGMRIIKIITIMFVALLLLGNVASCTKFVITDNMNDLKNGIESLECVEKLAYGIEGTPNTSYCGFNIVVYLQEDYCITDCGDTILTNILQSFYSNPSVVTDIDDVGAVEYGINIVDSNGNITYFASAMMPLRLSSVWSVAGDRRAFITTDGCVEISSDNTSVS